MHKTISIFLFMIMPFFGFSQSENYSTAIENFKKEYNAENFKGIFNSFSPEMKNALPLEKSKQFFNSLKSQAGKIEKYNFEGFSQGTFAEYKTKFEKMIFSVNMSVAENGEINGLFIKPYQETTEGNNKTVNALTNYPKDISEIIFSYTKEFPNSTQLSIAIVRNTKTKYYGIIKTNDTIKSIKNHNKVFEIGSITKVFTATVLASLVEDGKINLKDKINTYYPFTFHNNAKITFESLANHTSGLPRLPDNFNPPNPRNPYKDYNAAKLDTYLKDSLKLKNPLTEYAYSNLGVGLLGNSLALSQKINFKNLIQNRVLNRYHMKNTYLNHNHLNNLVKGRNPKGQITSNWDFGVLFGAGGMLSTATDLAKFVQAQFNPKNKDLALSRIPTFRIDSNLEIALGWHIIEKENKNDLYWHNGGTGGYRSMLIFDPKTENGVVILSNVSAFDSKSQNIDKLALNLMKEINQDK